MSERIVKVRKANKNNFYTKSVYSKCNQILTVGVDDNGILLTGLTVDDEKRLEEAMNLPSGSLKKIHIDRLADNDFWTNFKIMIPEDGLTLKPDTIPEHELILLVLKAKKKLVASSLTEFNMIPTAQYFIADEDMEAEVKVNRKALERKAWGKFDNMTPSEKREALIAMGKSVENSTDVKIEAALIELIESNFKRFIDTVENKQFKALVFVNRLINARILTRKGSMVLFDGEPLGHDVESTIMYLQDPKNANTYLALQTRLEVLKKEYVENINVGVETAKDIQEPAVKRGRPTKGDSTEEDK